MIGKISRKIHSSEVREKEEKFKVVAFLFVVQKRKKFPVICVPVVGKPYFKSKVIGLL